MLHEEFLWKEMIEPENGIQVWYYIMMGKRSWDNICAIEHMKIYCFWDKQHVFALDIYNDGSVKYKDYL